MGKLQYKSEYSGEPIASSNGLTKSEQEFCIYFSPESVKDGMAEIGSHIPSLTRALLRFPYFEVCENGLELSEPHYYCAEEEEPRVVSVRGQIPVQSILIKAPRKSSRLRNIIAGRKADND